MRFECQTPTDGIGLAVLSSHHEWGFASSIHTVHLCVMTQQELQTLHVICECCSVKRSPVTERTTITAWTSATTKDGKL